MKYVHTKCSGERDICGACVCTSVYISVCVYISVAFSMALAVARVSCLVVSVTEGNVQQYEKKKNLLKYFSSSLSTIARIFIVLHLGISASYTNSPFPPTLPTFLPSLPFCKHRSCSPLYLLSSASCHIALRLNISTF